MVFIESFVRSTSKLCLRSGNIAQRQLLQKKPSYVHDTGRVNGIQLFSSSSNLKADLYYTTSHEWISVDGDIGTVGISKYAQEKLGDVVFVGTPKVGLYLTKGEMKECVWWMTDGAAVIENVQDTSDILSPVSGSVLNINKKLQGDPKLVNKDPLKEGWIYTINIMKKEELDELMDAKSYKTFTVDQRH